MGQTGRVEEAKALAKQFADLAPGDDALRRLSDRTWQLLQDGGFLRALQPARWGGGELSLLEFIDTSLEISRASSSAGWVAGVIGVHPWQLALFAEEAQQEMWADDPKTMHSSSYNPTGKAQQAPGGYKLSGRWSFSSGCDHCRGVNLGAIAGTRELPGGVQAPDFRSFLLHPAQYRIEDNWHVAGLKGTGSKDIVVDEAFVPEHRTQSHLDYALSLPLPGQERNDGVLYRLPWSVVFNMALASSILGAARGYVDAWIEQSASRVVAGGVRIADDAQMQRRLAEATWDLDVATTRMRADAQELWQMAEARQAPSMAQRAQLRWNLNRGCEVVGRAVGDLQLAASGRAIFLDHPLQRRFQDVLAGLGHAFVLPDPLARAVGGALLGATKPEITL